MAQAFDPERLALSGDPIPVVKDVGATTTGYPAFSTSQTGVLVHARHIALPGQLRWFDRLGNELGLVGEPAEYLDFSLSPDGHMVAVSRVDDPGLASANVWMLDLVRNVWSRFISHPLNDASPVWSPDGARIAFRSNRDGYTKIYGKRSIGTEGERVMLDAGTSLIPTDWSSDGKWIVYTLTTSFAGFDMWVSSPDGTDKQVVVDTTLNASHGRLSPNGRWLAYASDESGEWQVWVQPFPATGEKRPISPSGGTEPQWRRDGEELFYLASSGALMSVAIPQGDAFRAQAPRRLFDVDVPLTGNPYHSNFVVMTDGQRFLVNTRAEARPLAMEVVLNWTTLVSGRR
jgi:eukaryotic-like serine/threonine-protein kinase